MALRYNKRSGLKQNPFILFKLGTVCRSMTDRIFNHGKTVYGGTERSKAQILEID